MKVRTERKGKSSNSWVYEVHFIPETLLDAFELGQMIQMPMRLSHNSQTGCIEGCVKVLDIVTMLRRLNLYERIEETK